jgi:uncharacterized membrane protein
VKLRGSLSTSPTPRSSLSLAYWLFIVAFVVIFIGMLLMSLGSVSNLNGVSGGAVILIGPIPIVLGSGPNSLPLIAMGVILTVLSLFLYLVLRRTGQQ